jgi:hypothetical protein
MICGGSINPMMRKLCQATSQADAAAGAPSLGLAGGGERERGLRPGRPAGAHEGAGVSVEAYFC